MGADDERDPGAQRLRFCLLAQAGLSPSSTATSTSRLLRRCPEYTVTLDGDKLQSIRWIGSEGNVLSSLDEGDYTVSGEGDKVTVKIAADFLKGKDAGNYGLQFEFASVAPARCR